MDYAPYLIGIMYAADDPKIAEIACMKAAQVAWTTCLIAMIGRRIDNTPMPIVGMFAAEGAAKDFNDEKFTPIVEATPKLSARIDVSTSRKSGNRALFKKFEGGFLKLVTSNSARSVKSTPARFVFVEEPDDAQGNVAQQGDSVSLLWERGKRMRNVKRVIGGTPSVKGLSRIEEHIDQSDKRVLPIVCGGGDGCGDAHVLDWENVSWATSETENHSVYGNAIPETAFYACPYCGLVWDDYRRKENIRETVYSALEAGDENGGWVATQKFYGVAGFTELNELYSCLPGAGMAELVTDYLNAQHAAENGDQTKVIVFQNSKLGRPYEYKDEQADADTLREIHGAYEYQDYAEMVCPTEGLLVTAGIDVQRNRLAVVLRAYGVAEESWLLYWGEMYSENDPISKNDAVLGSLDTLLFSPIKRTDGSTIYCESVTIDSSDGMTSDTVYHWVRKHNKKGKALVMAGKGSSSLQDVEIFTQPKQPVDHKNPKRRTKADKYGLRPYIIGTNKAKDLISGRIKQPGSGEGRMHVYPGVRSDYYEQVTSEVKAPHPKNPKRRVYQPKIGVRNEGLDCEVYALHAARAKRVHLMSPADWEARRAAIGKPPMGKRSIKQERRKGNW